MRIRILDRILVALAGILLLAGCAALAAQLFFQKDVIGRVASMLKNDQYRIWLIITLGLLVLLGCYCLLLLFRHRGRKDKFVMQKTENGELNISLKAMESMVQKCLDPHQELTVQSVRLENQKGGLLIRIRGTVAGGVSIPLTVDALQQQIKQYVTACSGVEVKDIRVQIESSGPDAKESLFAIEAPTTRALPGSAASKEEKPKEEPESQPAEITPEEVKQVLAEMPASPPAEAEKTVPQVDIPAAAVAVAEQLKSEAPPEDDDRPMHQRLFSNPEEPCVMPMPPAADEIREEKKEKAVTAGDEEPQQAPPAGGEPEAAPANDQPEEVPANDKPEGSEG